MSSRTPERSLWDLISDRYPAPPYTTGKVRGEDSRGHPDAVDTVVGRRAAIAAALVGDFARHGHVHEVRVCGVPETLFIVPTAAEGERLATHEQISRGRIWTARELADVLTTSASPEDFSAITLAKLAFDGEVVATIPRSGA